ncbi:MAG: hypothetical protein BWY50_01581 [Spirochaetes bacterium ADurb.Bin315]|nr:MAG: hypothetical protein BWY50_01581 [Spirochaetes bacterium ADurb.Bin315]
MGYIGGKLAALLLQKSFFRDIENEYRCSHRFVVEIDAACVDLVPPSGSTELHLSMSAVCSRFHDTADLAAAFHDEEILPDAGGIRSKHMPGCGIDGDDDTFIVQQHKTFVHALGDQGKFVAFFVEFASLAFNLSLLMRNAQKQRGKLVVGVVVQRMFKVKSVQGSDRALGDAVSQEC